MENDICTRIRCADIVFLMQNYISEVVTACYLYRYVFGKSSQWQVLQISKYAKEVVHDVE